MAYNPIGWENEPSQKTPLSQSNLRHMDNGIKEAHDEIEEIKERLDNGGGGGTGQDGFSPIATVTQTENGALIEIEDKNGKTSATVENGEDGFSPLINVSTLPNGYLVLIQTKDSAETMEILNGEDGVSPTIDVSKTGTLTTLTITDKNGEKKAFIVDGQNGVGIQEIATLSESKEDGGTSYYEIVLTNGTRKQISVKNGSKGSQGEQGIQGVQGIQGEKGEKGDKGDKGDTGAKGSDATVTTANITSALGYTPAKQSDVDSLSSEIADQNARISEAVNTEFENEKGNMVQLLISELQGLPVFGVVDENNLITITNQLSDGVYTLMYEKADGTTETVGTITIGSGVSYTNLADPTLTTDTTITTASQGWLEGVRINSSNNIVTADGNDISNIVPIGNEEIVRIKGMALNSGYGRIYFYSGNTYLYYLTPNSNTEMFTALTTEYSEITIAELLDFLQVNTQHETFDGLRFGGTLNTTKEDVIITLDEEIV